MTGDVRRTLSPALSPGRGMSLTGRPLGGPPPSPAPLYAVRRTGGGHALVRLASPTPHGGHERRSWHQGERRQAWRSPAGSRAVSGAASPTGKPPWGPFPWGVPSESPRPGSRERPQYSLDGRPVSGSSWRTSAASSSPSSAYMPSPPRSASSPALRPFSPTSVLPDGSSPASLRSATPFSSRASTPAHGSHRSRPPPGAQRPTYKGPWDRSPRSRPPTGRSGQSPHLALHSATSAWLLENWQAL